MKALRCCRRRMNGERDTAGVNSSSPSQHNEDVYLFVVQRALNLMLDYLLL